MQEEKKVVRYRLNVPTADESVHAWLAVQTNSSVSIRQLIRADIERNGYVDTMCSPVGQLPKRGRPALSSVLSELESVSSDSVPKMKEELTKPVPVIDVSSEPSVPSGNRMIDVGSMNLSGQKSGLSQNSQLNDLL